MFRTVYIDRASKLQYMQGFLVAFDGEEEKRILLSEISTLIIESTSSVITFPLLIELVRNNVSVVFCDEKHNPFGSIIGYNSHYRQSGNLFQQLEWHSGRIKPLWKHIVQEKIKLQRDTLLMFGKGQTDLLLNYLNDISEYDETNREGLAAKVYFTELYGKSFSRSEQNVINSYLDYGYSLLLSCFNREIVSSGYFTQIGIFHRGKTNPFNLSSDFMEPFRPIVDILVYQISPCHNPLQELRKIFTKKIQINQEERYVDDAIRVYTNQLLSYLNENTSFLPQLRLLSRKEYTINESNAINSNV